MNDKNRQNQKFVIDPDIFLSPPYQDCPNCGTSKSFGVLMICSQHYVRRCKNKKCWHSKSFPLPQIKKKVLYLDQFAISNMMKALKSSTEQRKDEHDDFWRELFRTVERLCKLQLLVCPESEFHVEESVVSPFPDALKRMYKLLSGGVRLYDSSRVECVQIYEHVQLWVAGKTRQPCNYNLKSIVYGDPDEWQDRFIFHMNWEYPDEWIDEIRKVRGTVHESMVNVFEGWRKEPQPFEYLLKEEARSYGESLIQSLDDIHTSQIIQSVRNGLKKVGIPEVELDTRTRDYLLSDAMERIPFNRISAMLYATIARQAGAGGRKKPPTQGITNDILFISRYLPYCDAMLVDKGCHGFLKEQPLHDELKDVCRVFSLKNKDEFLDYLGRIEKEASKEHLAKVKEVYGDDWGEPYESLYTESEV